MVIIDSNADKKILDKIGKYFGIQASAKTDFRLSGHVDLRMIKIKDILVVCPDDYEMIKSAFKSYDIRCGKVNPGQKYPYDIPYNAACVGGFMFCAQKYTDQVVLNIAKQKNIKIIPVKQGYCKCSIVPVGTNAVISDDKGICIQAQKHGLDALYVSHGNVLLNGYDYGFIGGTAVIFQNTIFFCGDISLHPDFYEIKQFCMSHGYDIMYIKNMPLYDYGSPLALF